MLSVSEFANHVEAHHRFCKQRPGLPIMRPVHTWKLFDCTNWITKRRYTSSRHSKLHGLYSVAARMNSKLILEVCASAAPTTIALAAAARQTGGHLICFLSDESALDEAMLAMKELNPSEVVEFIGGNAEEIHVRGRAFLPLFSRALKFVDLLG